MKANNEYRLYYSLSSPTPKLSAIGLATSTKIDGPWIERDLIVTSKDNIVMTNAIDPTVVVDPAGNQYLYYGSAWDGIYILELDPATGLAKNQGMKGKRIAMRGRTGSQANGNIEGPEIIYSDQFKKYYLFISYDWLSTKYNVRVGRSDSPTGPFTDFNGEDVNLEKDHGPMILAPYFFKNHLGWQGTGHCSVFRNGDQYFMSHQGRPVANFYYMVMHTRQIFWTEDGWPVVSPERYAATEQTMITKEELSGTWEQIILGYRVVPGYDKEQITPDLQGAVTLTLAADGSIYGSATNQWTYSGNQLTLKWSTGFTDKVIVSRGWDWENKKNCIVFSGLNNVGTAVWGKK
jgi:arabinan endo-1,5-alpha-L-arabinosidase